MLTFHCLGVSAGQVSAGQRQVPRCMGPRCAAGEHQGAALRQWQWQWAAVGQRVGEPLGLVVRHETREQKVAYGVPVGQRDQRRIPGLDLDRSEGGRGQPRKITISVDGNDHKASTIRASEVMVTTTHVSDLESGFPERLHHAPSANPGKASQGSDTSSSTMLGSGPLRGRGMPSLDAAST